MSSILKRVALILAVSHAATSAWAWDMSGTKLMALRTRDGKTIPIGTVTFAPKDGRIGYALDLDLSRLKEYFLSMREFKCLEGPEVTCFVPYPYRNPMVVTPRDLAWLETSLLFFTKTPADYGAKLGNGVYFAMKLTDEGLVGTPQSIDLDTIAAPPDDPAVPPFGPGERTEMTAGSRWVESLTIRDPDRPKP